MRPVRFLIGLATLGVVLAVLAGAAGLWVLWQYGRALPDYQQLAGYEPPVMTRVHAGDGHLIAEFARERRLFVPVEAIPNRVVNAFLAAEDDEFFEHPGIDLVSIVRAVFQNLRNLATDRRPVGASTITQQVAKNFLLTNEVSLRRKIKEAILAFRIEHAFPKERILELYLNEIYLGFGAYGVAAAALNYYDKSLDELSVAEAAYLAALPKAPGNYHPLRYRERARARRNWVIERMRAEGFITDGQALAAAAEPLAVSAGRGLEPVDARWFTEEIRRELLQRYGEGALYEGGLSVRTSMRSRLQEIGRRVLREGLMAYDRRHGWRGPLGRIAGLDDWRRRLADFEAPPGLLADWRTAVVLELGPEAAVIGLADGAAGEIALADLKWARAALDHGHLGSAVRAPADVLELGDVVAVRPWRDPDTGDVVAGRYELMQIPAVNGGLVAMDPHTGRVLALVGGWSFAASKYNRVTQAARQPGSAFKPIVYAAALESGFTPATLILDAPFVIDQGPGLGKWKPANYSNRFYGPSTLRLGIEKSRNLMTVRLAQHIGMDVVADYAERLGVVDELPEILSMALGAGETTLLRLTSAYAMMANGGKRITPTLIDRIQDRRGRTIFKHDDRACPDCYAVSWHGQREPRLPDTREPVLSPVTAYQMVSMLHGVVERGTGRRVRAVGKPLAGKTGTTNDIRDTWFIGFAPDLAVGVYVGFDEPRTLGRREQGASVAAPIFRDFMREALAGQPATPFRIPEGVRLVRVDAGTGLPARPGDDPVILEAFRPGTEPEANRAVLDGAGGPVATGARGGSIDGLY